MKFAHLADTHLGAFREKELRELNICAFERAFERCIAEHVDFIIIAGDLFHVALPEMSVIKRAVDAMQSARSRGIPIYLIYGSHDFTTNETSIIDVLGSTDLFTKIVAMQGEIDEASGEEKVVLAPFTDKKTGAKLFGMSGRKNGLERTYYDALDTAALEAEPGTKIFVFHSAVTEYKPEHLAEIASIPLSAFPRGFHYYASGHVHERYVHDEDGYGTITSPGPLFGSDYRDLEDLGTQSHGFFLVEIENEKAVPTFVPLDLCPVTMIRYSAAGKTAEHVGRELPNEVGARAVEGAIVLIKVRGELSAGTVTDIPFDDLRKRALERGAHAVYINRNGLTTKEAAEISISSDRTEDIEKRLFEEHIGGIAVTTPGLTGANGVALAEHLLAAFKEERHDGEKKDDFEEKIARRGLDAIAEALARTPRDNGDSAGDTNDNNGDGSSNGRTTRGAAAPPSDGRWF